MRHAARQLRAWLIFDVRQNQRLAPPQIPSIFSS
jgi:hypothetical protein